jgi:hypothetical protein
MASRKTVSVKDMVVYANQQLSRVDSYATKDFKSGISTMIESLLHMTDNYAGFMFNDNSDSEIDTVGYYSRTYFISNKLLKK